jgi:hypothetical protein
MMSARTAFPLVLTLLAGPAFAAPDAKEEEKTEKDAQAATEPLLPRSLRIHGVIGYIELPDGIEILDPAILARMRARLAEKAGTGE